MEASTAPAQELHLHGLVELTNEQYHSAPGMSSSKLHAIAVSPLNYWDQFENPEREPREYKHCFAVGDGTHKLVLEPGTFEKTYAVGFDKTAYPDALDLVADLKRECTARKLMVSGTKGELVDRLLEDGFPAERLMLVMQREHEKTMGGRIPIPARDYKDMMGMLRAVNSHHTAAGLVRDAFVEQSYFFTDQYGIVRKCRPDIITSNGRVMADLKTTDDVSLHGFGRTIVQRRYEVQAAWYLDILRMLYGDDAPSVFAFIPAQKGRPYDVAVHWLNEDQIARGRRLYQQDLETYLRCRDANQWPGADGGQILEAKFPRWAEYEEGWN